MKARKIICIVMGNHSALPSEVKNFLKFEKPGSGKVTRSLHVIVMVGRSRLTTTYSVVKSLYDTSMVSFAQKLGVNLV